MRHIGLADPTNILRAGIDTDGQGADRCPVLAHRQRVKNFLRDDLTLPDLLDVNRWGLPRDCNRLFDRTDAELNVHTGGKTGCQLDLVANHG